MVAGSPCWAGKAACTRHRAADAGQFVADLEAGTPRELRSVERFPRLRRLALFYVPVGWSPDGRRVLCVEERWTEGDCGIFLGGRLRRTTLFHVGVAGGLPTRAGDGGPAE
jgi:hypothetical protein